MASSLLRSLVLVPRSTRTATIQLQKSCNMSTKQSPLNILKNNPRNTKNQGKLIMVTWKTLLVGLVCGGGMWIYMKKLQEEKDLKIERERKRSLGKAAIGGTFELVDENGKTVKSEDFFGKWVLIYFGFTHCPDVCPDELEKMSLAVDKLQSQGFPIQPIFITVDPNRDTPAAVAKYVKEFSDKIIGLSGSVDQIAKVCKAYRVYFSNGPADQDNDYIVDHTIILYLVDPEGAFVDYFGQTHTADMIVDGCQLHKFKWEKAQSGGSWLPSLNLNSLTQAS